MLHLRKITNNGIIASAMVLPLLKYIITSSFSPSTWYYSHFFTIPTEHRKFFTVAVVNSIVTMVLQSYALLCHSLTVTTTSEHLTDVHIQLNHAAC